MTGVWFLLDVFGLLFTAFKGKFTGVLSGDGFGLIYRHFEWDLGLVGLLMVSYDQCYFLFWLSIFWMSTFGVGLLSFLNMKKLSSLIDVQRQVGYLLLMRQKTPSSQ